MPTILGLNFRGELFGGPESWRNKAEKFDGKLCCLCAPLQTCSCRPMQKQTLDGVLLASGPSVVKCFETSPSCPRCDIARTNVGLFESVGYLRVSWFMLFFYPLYCLSVSFLPLTFLISM